jgi:hypothetical protein
MKIQPKNVVSETIYNQFRQLVDNKKVKTPYHRVAILTAAKEAAYAELAIWLDSLSNDDYCKSITEGLRVKVTKCNE